MAPTGYTAVTATSAELSAWRAKNPNRPQPSTRRLQCNFCDKRIWGSGLGVGAHNRSKACAAIQSIPEAQRPVLNVVPNIPFNPAGAARAAATPRIPRTNLAQQVITVERFQLYPAGGGNYRSAWQWSYNYHVNGGPLCQYGPGLKSLRSMFKERFPGARIVETWIAK